MYQFGEFTLDIEQARLICQNVEIDIEPKLFELLVMFVNQPNSIISRQDILDKLWADSLVTDNAINKLVANLRKTLKDSSKNSRYIQTVPKRGYRLICQVKLLSDENSDDKNVDGYLKADIDTRFVDTTVINKNLNVNQAQVVEQTNLHKSHNKTALNTKSVTAFLFLVISVFIWQSLSSDSDNNQSQNKPNVHRYSIELTRAHGAEESAKMHPNGEQLYYLKRHNKTGSKSSTYQLWLKDIQSAKTQQIKLQTANINQIIAITTGQSDHSSHLIYLDKKPNQCTINKAVIQLVNKEWQWTGTETLFDCSDKRIKDIDYHATKRIIYYTAQPRNLWPNQIYAFNLKTNKHSLVTQITPEGWGHHNIDISPNGEKLLIMSTKGDYQTQLLALNLVTQKITEGVKLKYPVTEAIWHHDSQQVYYYAEPPAHQIILSDFEGTNSQVLIGTSEYLSPQMSRFPDGQNVLFSTERKNHSNRWLASPDKVSDIDNSTVNDTSPALFHHSNKYFFISKRSGKPQLYLSQADSNKTEIITNFSQAYWLSHLAISANDNRVVINADNNIYHIPMDDLISQEPIESLTEQALVFTSDHPIIALDWLSTNTIAITQVKSGTPELVVVDLRNNKTRPIKGNWAYGLSDSQNPQYSYLIEQQSHNIYRIGSSDLEDDSENVGEGKNDLSPHSLSITHSQITPPPNFYHVKIDNGILYFGNSESDGDYLNAKPINNDQSKQYRLNDLNSYDVSMGNIMLSDIESLEGDVHRTVD